MNLCNCNLTSNNSLRLGEIEIIEKGLMIYAGRSYKTFQMAYLLLTCYLIVGNGVIESVHDISKQAPTRVQALLQGLEAVTDFSNKLIIPGIIISILAKMMPHITIVSFN